MKKPEPYTEKKKLLNFIEMGRWIDEKYGIVARDYAGKFCKGPKWVDVMVEQGIELERAKVLMKTRPDAVTDPLETKAMVVAGAVTSKHLDNTPYQDFWHYQIDLFNNFSNDSYQTLNLNYQLKACKHDWQREIAQLWLDEFGKDADEEGNVDLWVSW